MRLGVNLGYWGAEPDWMAFDLAEEADRLGLAVVWVAEAYGADAATVLSHVAARTSRIDVGSAVFQIPARSPAMTAMTAATLDALSGGRFRLGLGVSGPQVSEGWHGVPFADPLGRTREYVDVVRAVLRRDRVSYDGRHYPLPLPGGPGKPLRLTLHPARARIPLYLAALGPRNVELAGALADGWLATFFSPEHAEPSLAAITAGRASVGRDLDGFDVAASVPLSVGNDVADCADRVRNHAALYLGGMGGRDSNVYHKMAVRMGYASAARTVQDRYLAGDVVGAAAAVPLEFLDDTSLLGGPDRIAERMKAYAAAGVTTLSVSVFADHAEQRAGMLRTAVDALEASGVGE